MHKYHLADLLTLTECIMAGVMVWLTVVGADPGWAFLVFVVGELCDAFDGVCARKWHYPEDGKKRWWRANASLTDQISDVTLGLTTLIFAIRFTNTDLAFLLTLAALFIAIPIQLVVNHMERQIRRGHFSSRQEKRVQSFVDSIVLFRRHLYIFAIVALLVLLALYAGWSPLLREAVLGIGTIVGLIIWVIKKDRRTQNRTPL